MPRRIFAPIVWLVLATLCVACVSTPADRAATAAAALNSPVAATSPAAVAASPSPASPPTNTPTLAPSATPDATAIALGETIRVPANLSAGDPYVPELGNAGYAVQRYTLQVTLDRRAGDLRAPATITVA